MARGLPTGSTQAAIVGIVCMLAAASAEPCGEKLEHYRQIPALGTVVLVSHREPSVEVWQRLPDGAWAHTAFGSGEIAVLDVVSARLDVDEIYAAAREPDV